MKILFVSPLNKKYHLINFYIYKYLKEKLNHKIDLCDYREEFFNEKFLKFKGYSIGGYLNHIIVYIKLLSKILYRKYDLIFFIKGEIFKGWFLKFLKKFSRRAVYINWFMDAPHLLPLAEKIGKYYDIFFLNCSYSEQFLKNKNINAKFIPFGYIREVFYKDKVYEKYKCDILFIGSYSKEREKVLKFVQNFNLHIYGPGWKDSYLKDKVKGEGLYAEEMRKAFNSAKIVINIHRNFLFRKNKKLYGNSINLRVFEALGSAAFLLSDEKKDIIKLFKNKKELVLYKNLDELKKYIKFYLKNESKRKKIALNGYKKVKSYSLDKILNIIIKDVINFRNNS